MIGSPDRPKLFLRIVVVLVCGAGLILGILFAVHNNQIGQNFNSFLERRVREVFGLTIRVERIHGSLWGKLILEGLTVQTGEADVLEDFFKADAVSFQYRWLDFIRQRFSGSVEITIERPQIYADVPLSKGARSGRGLAVLSKLVQKIQNQTVLHIRDGRVVWLGREGDLSGLEGDLSNQSFDFRLDLNHISLSGADVSTQIHLEGHLESHAGGSNQELSGQLTTERTIVNWKPVPAESSLKFGLKNNELVIYDTRLLDGIKLDGRLSNFFDPKIDVNIRMKDYPLSHFNNLLSRTIEKQLGGTMDAEFNMTGSFFEPTIRGKAIILNTRMGDKDIKNVQLNIRGVFPDIQIFLSRVVLADGMIMDITDEQVFFSELFKSSTYRRLIEISDQKTVAWGDWRLLRNDEAKSTVLERGIGDSLKVRYEEYDQAPVQTTEGTDNREVGMEYSLTDSESLQLRLMNDDEFLGVQRKVEF